MNLISGIPFRGNFSSARPPGLSQFGRPAPSDREPERSGAGGGRISIVKHRWAHLTYGRADLNEFSTDRTMIAVARYIAAEK